MPQPVYKGPYTADVYIVNQGGLRVRPTDRENNYLYRPTSQPDQFDAVNTMAIICRVMTMYRYVTQ